MLAHNVTNGMLHYTIIVLTDLWNVKKRSWEKIHKSRQFDLKNAILVQRSLEKNYIKLIHVTEKMVLTKSRKKAYNCVAD